MLDARKALRSIQYAFAVSRQTWNHAKTIGTVINTDWPYKNEMKKINIDNQRMRFLSPDEAMKLFKKIQEHSQQLHDISLLSFHSGLRAGEIFSLKWSNVNIDEGIINILDAKAGSRTAFMTNQIKDMFKRLGPGNPDELVFKNRHGKKIVEVSNTFNRIVDELGFNKGITDRRERLCFHSLRHSFASQLAQSGVSLYVIQKLMGHKQLSLTERYSHLSDVNLKAAVSIFEKNLNDKILTLKKKES